MAIPPSVSNITRATGGAAATEVVEFFRTSEDEIARIYAANIQLSAGVSPPNCYIQLTNQEDANNFVIISNVVTAIAESVPLELWATMVPPNTICQGRHQGGDAATITAWSMYKILVPVGTVFYV